MAEIIELYKGRQLCAVRLDNEIYEMIRNQTNSLFDNIAPTFTDDDDNTAVRWIRDHLKPEIELIVYACFYGLSLGCHGVSPGMRVVGLKSHNASPFDETRTSTAESVGGINPLFLSMFGFLPRTVRKRFALYTVLLWIYLRLKHLSVIEGWQRYDNVSMKKKLWKYLQVIEFSFKMFSFTNSFSFLVTGFYPTILHRLMGFHMVSNDSDNKALHPLALYRSRQYLWQVLGGFFAALSIARNWSEVQYILETFSSAASYTTALLTRPVIMLGNLAVSATDSMYRYLLGKIYKLLGINAPEEESVDVPVAEPVTNIANVYVTLSSSGGSSSSAISLRSDLYDVPPKCNRCDTLPAETPHYLPVCGHVYCYLCLPKLIKRSSSSNSDKHYACLVCQKVSTDIQPMTNR